MACDQFVPAPDPAWHDSSGPYADEPCGTCEEPWCDHAKGAR